jgi:hypothetical protein
MPRRRSAKEMLLGRDVLLSRSVILSRKVHLIERYFQAEKCGVILGREVLPCSEVLQGIKVLPC